MTSTNDGKEVNSNQTSAPKGKSYYIELYKSLEAGLTGVGTASEHTRHLCEAWRRVHSLCLHSTASTHPHLLTWLQRHTARTVLQTEWQSSKRKDDRTSLEEAINAFIVESGTAAAARSGPSPCWESQLVARGEWFKRILDNPWKHPVLNCLLNPGGTPPTNDEVLKWLTEERGVTFVMRLHTLVSEKCDDIAVSLATAVMERVRADTEQISDLEQADETKVPEKPENPKSIFGDRLRDEAGFTVDVWETLTDIEFVLLHKRDSSKCIALAKLTPLHSAYQLIERLQSRLDTAPREKRLWKNSKEVAVLIAQMVIARCMVVPRCAGGARSALYRCARSLARLVPHARLPAAARALAAPAPTAHHLHMLAAAIDAHRAQQKEASMKPFVCELYVRAITAGMNELERLKLKADKDTEARSMEATLAGWFVQLGNVLGSSRVACECALTAFSLHPSRQMYERIQAARHSSAQTDAEEQPNTEATNAFGSWAHDSRSQTNFVKTSETLNMKSGLKQANVLSTAILNDGEALGLSPELCQDIAVLLSGPRVKTLSWDMDRELLLENCRAYMERTNGGTKALTTELKFLNLDPSKFLHLPEEDDDENNIYYGIEKGYEHLVQFPEPEDIWQDVRVDNEKTDTASSCEEYLEATTTLQRKEKTKRNVTIATEEDPLSLAPETKRIENTERPLSKERSKKKVKNPTEVKEKQVEKKKAPKEKKERKKKEKVPKPQGGPLSKLLGLRVAKKKKAPKSLQAVLGSGCDSQGKSSLQYLNSEGNKSRHDSQSSDNVALAREHDLSNASVSGITSNTVHFDRPHRPPSVHSTQTQSQSSHSRNVSPTFVSEEVKTSISKLLEFRRQKALDDRKTPNAIRRPEDLDKDVISPKAVVIPEIPKSYINKPNDRLTELQQQVNDMLTHRPNEAAAIPSPVIQYARSPNKQILISPSRYDNDQIPSTSDRFMKSVNLVSIYDKNEPHHSQTRPFYELSQDKLKSKEPVNYHDFLHEYHSSFNTFNAADRSEPKKVIRPISRVTPVIPHVNKSEKSPQSAKQIQQKKPDGSLNTFSRLSYYKNKQTDMRNKTCAQNPTLTNTVGSKLEGFILNHLLQSKDKSQKSFNELQQTRARDTLQSKVRDHPTLTNILQGRPPQKPVSPLKNTLSEKDQHDLILLLRQQNLLNKPVSTSTRTVYPIESHDTSFNPQTSMNETDRKKIAEGKMINVISNTVVSLAQSAVAGHSKQKSSNPKKPRDSQIKISQPKKTESHNEHRKKIAAKSEEWQNVMNALAKHKTPCRGPNALDMALNKSSFEKAFEDSLRNPSRFFITNKTISSERSSESAENSDTDYHYGGVNLTKSTSGSSINHVKPIAETKTPNTVDKAPHMPKSSSSESKNINSKISPMIPSHQKFMKQNNVEKVKKQTKATHTNKTRDANDKNAKLSNIGRRTQKVMLPKCDAKQMLETPAKMHQERHPKQYTNEVKLDPYLLGIPNSDYDLLEELMDDDLRKEIGEISSDEESYTTAARSFLKDNKSVEKRVHLVFNDCLDATTPKEKSMNSAAQTVRESDILQSYAQKTETLLNTSSLLPQPIRNETSVSSMNELNVQNSTTHIVTNTSQAYNNANMLQNTPISIEPNVYITALPQPAPLQNVVLIGSDLVYEGYASVQTPIQSVTHIAPNPYMAVGSLPNMNVYHTTQFTPPIVSPVILASAVTVPIVANNFCTTTPMQSNHMTSVTQSTYAYASTEVNYPSLHEDLGRNNTSINANRELKERNITNPFQSENDANFSKYGERKVLIEVQDKNVDEKAYCKRRESNDKELKNHADQDRVRRKRLAILNREINQLCGNGMVIALEYSPLHPVTKIDNEKCKDIKNAIDVNVVSSMTNSVQELEVKSPATPDSLENFKENENEAVSVRRILLRSSNKLKSSSSIIHPPLVKKFNETVVQGSQNKSTGNTKDDADKNKTKRVSKRIRNKSTTSAKIINKDHTKTLINNSKFINNSTTNMENKVGKKSKKIAPKQDLNTELCDIETELLGSTIPRISPRIHENISETNQTVLGSPKMKETQEIKSAPVIETLSTQVTDLPIKIKNDTKSQEQLDLSNLENVGINLNNECKELNRVNEEFSEALDENSDPVDCTLLNISAELLRLSEDASTPVIPSKKSVEQMEVNIKPPSEDNSASVVLTPLNKSAEKLEDGSVGVTMRNNDEDPVELIKESIKTSDENSVSVDDRLRIDNNVSNKIVKRSIDDNEVALTSGNVRIFSDEDIKEKNIGKKYDDSRKKSNNLSMRMPVDPNVLIGGRDSIRINEGLVGLSDTSIGTEVVQKKANQEINKKYLIEKTNKGTVATEQTLVKDALKIVSVINNDVPSLKPTVTVEKTFLHEVVSEPKVNLLASELLSKGTEKDMKITNDDNTNEIDQALEMKSLSDISHNTATREHFSCKATGIMKEKNRETRSIAEEVDDDVEIVDVVQKPLQKQLVNSTDEPVTLIEHTVTKPTTVPIESVFKASALTTVNTDLPKTSNKNNSLEAKSSLKEHGEAYLQSSHSVKIAKSQNILQNQVTNTNTVSITDTSNTNASDPSSESSFHSLKNSITIEQLPNKPGDDPLKKTVRIKHINGKVFKGTIRGPINVEAILNDQNLHSLLLTQFEQSKKRYSLQINLNQVVTKNFSGEVLTTYLQPKTKPDTPIETVNLLSDDEEETISPPVQVFETEYGKYKIQSMDNDLFTKHQDKLKLKPYVSLVKFTQRRENTIKTRSSNRSQKKTVENKTDVNNIENPIPLLCSEIFDDIKIPPTIPKKYVQDLFFDIANKLTSKHKVPVADSNVVLIDDSSNDSVELNQKQEPKEKIVELKNMLLKDLGVANKVEVVQPTSTDDIEVTWSSDAIDLTDETLEIEPKNKDDLINEEYTKILNRKCFVKLVRLDYIVPKLISSKNHHTEDAVKESEDNDMMPKPLSRSGSFSLLEDFPILDNIEGMITPESELNISSPVMEVYDIIAALEGKLLTNHNASEPFVASSKCDAEWMTTKKSYTLLNDTLMREYQNIVKTYEDDSDLTKDKSCQTSNVPVSTNCNAEWLFSKHLAHELSLKQPVPWKKSYNFELITPNNVVEKKSDTKDFCHTSYVPKLSTIVLHYIQNEDFLSVLNDYNKYNLPLTAAILSPNSLKRKLNSIAALPIAKITRLNNEHNEPRGFSSFSEDTALYVASNKVIMSNNLNNLKFNYSNKLENNYVDIDLHVQDIVMVNMATSDNNIPVENIVVNDTLITSVNKLLVENFVNNVHNDEKINDVTSESSCTILTGTKSICSEVSGRDQDIAIELSSNVATSQSQNLLLNNISGNCPIADEIRSHEVKEILNESSSNVSSKIDSISADNTGREQVYLINTIVPSEPRNQLSNIVSNNKDSAGNYCPVADSDITEGQHEEICENTCEIKTGVKLICDIAVYPNNESANPVVRKVVEECYTADYAEKRIETSNEVNLVVRTISDADNTTELCENAKISEITSIRLNSAEMMTSNEVTNYESKNQVRDFVNQLNTSQSPSLGPADEINEKMHETTQETSYQASIDADLVHTDGTSVTEEQSVGSSLNTNDLPCKFPIVGVKEPNHLSAEIKSTTETNKLSTEADLIVDFDDSVVTEVQSEKTNDTLNVILFDYDLVPTNIACGNVKCNEDVADHLGINELIKCAMTDKNLIEYENIDTDENEPNNVGKINEIIRNISVTDSKEININEPLTVQNNVTVDDETSSTILDCKEYMPLELAQCDTIATTEHNCNTKQDKLTENVTETIDTNFLSEKSHARNQFKNKSVCTADDELSEKESGNTPTRTNKPGSIRGNKEITGIFINEKLDANPSKICGEQKDRTEIMKFQTECMKVEHGYATSNNGTTVIESRGHDSTNVTLIEGLSLIEDNEIIEVSIVNMSDDEILNDDLIFDMDNDKKLGNSCNIYRDNQDIFNKLEHIFSSGAKKYYQDSEDTLELLTTPISKQNTDISRSHNNQLNENKESLPDADVEEIKTNINFKEVSKDPEQKIYYEKVHIKEINSEYERNTPSNSAVCHKKCSTSGYSFGIKEDAEVEIQGMEYEDPEIGTCYVFPIIEEVSELLDDDSQIDEDEECDEIIQKQKQESFSKSIGKNENEVLAGTQKEGDVADDLSVFTYESDIQLIIPKQTYASNVVIQKSLKNMKRKKDMSDFKFIPRKYRKGKNIDYPKITATAIGGTVYAKEYKRIIDYCSSVKFSYSIPFHIECIDVGDMHNAWPIHGGYELETNDTDHVENVLYTDIENGEGVPDVTDPLNQSLTDEINNGDTINSYKPIDINETNFSMGFGERSGRVIKELENGNTKSSAATLSDVKPHQPFSVSEDRNLSHEINKQNNKTKCFLNCFTLREKVQSFFKNTALQLSNDLPKGKKYDQSLSNDSDLSNFPFGLTNMDFFMAPTRAIVNVVQVGQVPVSGNNPVTCDPRVTQVSDASPSQCSDENSPGEDSQATIGTEYTELTTANITLPLQEYVQHHQTPAFEEDSISPPTGDTAKDSTMSIVKIELMEETSQERNQENENDIIYENDFSPLPNNNVEYSFDETSNTIFNQLNNVDSSMGHRTNDMFNNSTNKDNSFTNIFNATPTNSTFTDLKNGSSLNTVNASNNIDDTANATEKATSIFCTTDVYNTDKEVLPENSNVTNMESNSETSDVAVNLENSFTTLFNHSSGMEKDDTMVEPPGTSINSTINLGTRSSDINIQSTNYDYSYENMQNYTDIENNNTNIDNYPTNVDSYNTNIQNYESNENNYANVENYGSDAKTFNNEAENYTSNMDNYRNESSNYAPNLESFTSNVDNSQSNTDRNNTNINNGSSNILEQSQPQDLSLASSSQMPNLRKLSTEKSQESATTEKRDQIAHAMNAAGITSESSDNDELTNLINQSAQPESFNTPVTTNTHYSKTPIGVMTLQQALAQVLPPPLTQTGSFENNQVPNNPVTQQVLHIVQGSNAPTVINKTNGTHLLHIVQNKNAPNANGLSLVEGGMQQGNQLIHIVNNGKQNSTGQFLKRVNLLTNVANAQGSNEQKMIQFVCKSADGKSIQLNTGHQRSMVLRLHPTSVQTVPKPTEPQDLSTPTTSAANPTNSQETSEQDLKSRSVYDENYVRFVQNTSSPSQEKSSTSLPKFNQVFGKQPYSDNKNEMNANGIPENTDSQTGENNGHIEQTPEASSPPLLVRNPPPPETTQSSHTPTQQVKKTITPFQTMHGGVIYTRQIPVNLGGQTINLITVPSTELVDEPGQKQQADANFGNQEGNQPSIIKLVPHPHAANNTNLTTEENTTPAVSTNETSQIPQTQPVLTQMRIKLPMLSKGPHIVPGTRLIRPSIFQIQRNVIAGTNQPVYQQLVLTTAPSLAQPIRLPNQQLQPSQQGQTPQQAAQPALQPRHVHQAQPNQSQTVQPTPTNRQQSQSHAQQRQQAQPNQHAKPDTEPDTELSTLTMEQLREFDMVLEQVKERSIVQPPLFPTCMKPIPYEPKTSADSTDASATTTSVSESTQQVLYSVENNHPANVVSYVNRKSTITSATTSYVRSPDSSGIVETPSSSTQVQITHTVTSKSTTADHLPVAPPKKKKKKKSSSSSSALAALNNSPSKASTLKPQEDEQTTQRILYILAEYKEQVENSPDKNKPAPRRRNQFPPTTGSKRKRSHCSSRASCRRGDMSPEQGDPGENGDDSLITLGSEDSSCGTTFSECTECQESHSPEDSPRKVVRRLTFEQETTTQITTQTRTIPQRNVIVGDGQTITVARTTTTAKPTTTVLMPANYLLPVSMIKGGQQIAIMTNRGPKLLVGAGDNNAGALLFQRLIGPGLKPVLARPGVRHIRLPTTAVHNLQTFNIQTTPVTQVQPPDSTAPQAQTPAPPDLVDTRAMSSPWQDRDAQDKPDREPSPDCTEPWSMPSSSIADDYGYEEIVRTDNMERTVLDAIPDRYSPDMEAQRIFDKMFDVDSKKLMYDSPRCGYDIDASDTDDKPYHQVVQQRKDGRHHRVTHVSTAALRHKYAILEHELRLQKSLSEECEDLGVDSPSASDLFPEADILFGAPSPAHEQTIDECNTPPPIPLTPAPHPDLEDQAASDQLLTPPAREDLDLNLDDVGEIVTVGEDGVATIPSINPEEFARSHPNTTFHTEPEDAEIPPFTIAQGIKGRHITFHANRVPGTVVMAPQTTVISQASINTTDANNTVKFTDIDNMINSMPGPQTASTVNKDQPKPLSKFDSLLQDSTEPHHSNTPAIVHSAGHGTQVIRRLRYDDRHKRFPDEPRSSRSISDEVKLRNDRAMVESMGDNASSPGQPELFWDTAAVRNERKFQFNESEKVTKSPFDELLNDSSAYGPHTRLDSVIKAARPERSFDRTSFEGISMSGSSDDSRPLRTYPPKRAPQQTQDMEKHFTKTHHDDRNLKTHHHELKKSLPRCQDEGRRRASGRGVVKRGCSCCNGSTTASPKKKSRPKKPPPDFVNS